MGKPVIRKTSDGTKLIWEMDELEPGDQIVLEYFVNPLFKVEEDVELPEAEIEVDKHRIGTTDRVSARFDTGET